MRPRSARVSRPCLQPRRRRVAADAGAIQRVKFNFTKLHQLPDLPAGRVVDVLGMVKEEGDVVEITTKRGDKLAKRDLTIVDESNTSVQLTLWG